MCFYWFLGMVIGGETCWLSFYSLDYVNFFLEILFVVRFFFLGNNIKNLFLGGGHGDD